MWIVLNIDLVPNILFGATKPWSHEIARKIAAVFGPLGLPRMLTVPTLLKVANISGESASLVNDITRISHGAAFHKREVSSEEMCLCKKI